MTDTAFAPAALTAMQSGLARWRAGALRDLPWRNTRDPWKVVVAEAMLQQTQVSRVLERYPLMLERFPSVHACAGARVGEVVALWSGLGYNRRAVQLHRLAGVVVERHGGCFPQTLAELMALPGVGAYTARAIMAFAFELDVAVVDTNVGRVLARLANRTLGPATAQRLADTIVPPGDAWAWNQGLLDFGATICTARAPRCHDCPIAEHCAWRGRGGDPARGSAHVSRGQSAFAGSDRQGRGRLVAALASGPIAPDALAVSAGWPDDPERALRAMTALVRDGLAAFDGVSYRLP